MCLAPFAFLNQSALGEKMDFKRSALLTAGVVFAASLIANAASPASPVSTDSPEKPACAAAKEPLHKSALSGASAATKNADNAECVESTESSSGSASSSASPQPAASIVKPAGNAAAPAAPKSAFSIGPLVVVKPIKPLSSDPAPPIADQANTTLTPEGLAVADTALGYCAQVDAIGASAYQSALPVVTQGHDAAETAALRLSPDYAKTQAAFNEGLATVPAIAGASACRSFIG